MLFLLMPELLTMLLLWIAGPLLLLQGPIVENCWGWPWLSLFNVWQFRYMNRGGWCFHKVENNVCTGMHVRELIQLSYLSENKSEKLGCFLSAIGVDDINDYWLRHFIKMNWACWSLFQITLLFSGSYFSKSDGPLISQEVSVTNPLQHCCTESGTLSNCRLVLLLKKCLCFHECFPVFSRHSRYP